MAEAQHGPDESPVLTITIEAPPGSGEGIDAGVYDSFFGDLLACLRAVARVIRPPDAPAVRFRVVGLHMSQPTFDVAPVTGDPQLDRRLAEGWVDNARALEAGAADVPFSDRRVLESYDKLAEYVTTGKLGRVTISSGGREASAGTPMRLAVERILGATVITTGSFAGRLEYLNVHDGLRCRIYLGLGGHIDCVFGEDLLPEVIAAVRKRVRIHGRLHFRGKHAVPDLIEIRTIELYPSDEDLPSLDELWGSVPEITEGKTVEQYLIDLRGSNG